VPASVAVFGPFAGVLQGAGENLELQRPDTPDTNGIPYITVEAVRYSNGVPWPVVAEGTGESLQRRVSGEYGNDPSNWIAVPATPGTDNTSSSLPFQLSVSRSGTSITLSWNPGVSGYLLESADQLPSGSWNAVAGVTNNSVSITPADGNRFYRLKKL
jgi:hypothetical protein